MVNRQDIVSPIFSAKGKLSPAIMRNLLVRGSGLQVDDSLRRWGWVGASPVAASVVTVVADSGVVEGLRYETRGVGPSISFKASELWQGASEDVSLRIRMRSDVFFLFH